MGRQTGVYRTQPDPESTVSRGTTLSHRWTHTIRRYLIIAVYVLVAGHDVGKSVVYHVTVAVGHTSRSLRSKGPRRVRAQTNHDAASQGRTRLYRCTTNCTTTSYITQAVLCSCMSEGLVLSDLCLACDAPWAKGEPGLVGWSRDLRRTTGTSHPWHLESG